MPETADLVEALKNPKLYPHSPSKVELLQTQMSFVFLTGDYVYKVKKPVDLGYLDYTTLEKRRFFCHQELNLNRRLSPEVYLEVVPIVEKDGQIVLGGAGEVIEYAVKMRQLPSERMMDVLLANNQVSQAMVRRVAGKLAHFHSQAATNQEISQYGGLEIINLNCRENFTQTEKYRGISLSAVQYHDIKTYTENFINENKELFQQRVKEGRIKDCHGDLHSAHVCFIDDICIYDCIEFNDRFRYSDVASEIAFLAMDLDYHQQPSLSKSFANAYVEISHDEALLKLLGFYQCYRAYVRGKVEGFKLDDPFISAEEKENSLNKARKYFTLAHSYAQGSPVPFVIITAGLVGTGKTSISQALGEKINGEVISSDATRKRLAGLPLTEHRFEEFESGLYSEDFSRKTYHKMLAEAEEILARGQSVILDASFRKAEERAKARQLAEKFGAGFLVIECVLDKNEVKRRLEQRLKEGTISDGRWEIFLRQKEEFDKINEFWSENHLIVDTSKPLAELLTPILSRLLSLQGK